MSYSLYLWQELFLDYGVTGLRFDFPFNLIALAVTSLFSYYCIEQAFPGLRQRFSR
jgi:peptidoglycan/LPS O-acetylase OafA/YrhL